LARHGVVEQRDFLRDQRDRAAQRSERQPRTSCLSMEILPSRHREAQDQVQHVDLPAGRPDQRHRTAAGTISEMPSSAGHRGDRQIEPPRTSPRASEPQRRAVGASWIVGSMSSTSNTRCAAASPSCNEAFRLASLQRLVREQ